MRAKIIDFERGVDPKRSVGIGREAQMWKELGDMDVVDFIDYLDDGYKSPELSKFQKYRNPQAQYDDQWYKNIPLDELESVGITEELLDLIYANTPQYEGWMSIYPLPGNLEKLCVTLGGGA